VLALRGTKPRTVMLTGILALILGVTVTLIALRVGSTALFFVGTAISGIGFGSGFQGGIRTVVPLAQAHERTGVISLLFVISYLGMGVPSVAAGYLTVHGQGLIGATRQYGVALIVLGVLALTGLSVRSRTRRGSSCR
jgi:MFS family permease